MGWGGALGRKAAGGAVPAHNVVESREGLALAHALADPAFALRGAHAALPC